MEAPDITTCIGCPACGASKTTVNQTQTVTIGWITTRRRRHVCSCGHRYHTIEIPESLAKDVLADG